MQKIIDGKIENVYVCCPNCKFSVPINLKEKEHFNYKCTKTDEIVNWEDYCDSYEFSLENYNDPKR